MVLHEKNTEVNFNRSNKGMGYLLNSIWESMHRQVFDVKCALTGYSKRDAWTEMEHMF